MIKNEVNTTAQSTVTEQSSAVTSPISKDYSKSDAKKSTGFVAWLKDQDTVDENNGKISASVAATSFAKGLLEIVKTVYKKPLASAVTIATGAVLTFFAHYSVLSIVMGICLLAGVAGIAYAGYTISKTSSSNIKKQAYEVLGISMFVIGIGIYGLLI